VVCGCTTSVPPEIDDPYGGASGKADARSAFFEAGRLYQFEIRDLGRSEDLAQVGADGWSASVEAKGNAELRFRAEDASRDYEDFVVRRYAAESTRERPAFEVKLDDGHRLAGSRTLLFLPDDGMTGLRAQVATRLLDAVEVAAPYIASATLVLDGEPMGLYMLVEHDGDRFLDDRFDDEGGDRFVASDAAPGDEAAEDGAALLLDRLGGERVGPRVLSSVLDVSAFVGLGAARAAAGADLAMDDQTELYNACKRDAPCFAPIVHGSGRGLASDPSQPLPTHPPDDGLIGRTLRQLQLVPSLRARHAQLLERAEQCFAPDGCVEAAVAAHVSMLESERDALAAAGAPPLDEAATGELHAWLSARREAIADFLDREHTMDAPDGQLDYAPALIAENGHLVLQYRHFGERHAHAVTLERPGRAPLPMDFDRDANVWRAELGVETGAFEYMFSVALDDGVVESRRDPASRAEANGRSLLDVHRVDAPVLVREAELGVPEPSGLAWWGDQLAVVSDAEQVVYLVDPDSFAVVERIELDTHWKDAEGIAVDSLYGRFLIVFEAGAVVGWFSADGEELEHERLRWADDTTNGLEGIALRAWDGMLFFAKEKEPARIALWDDARTEVQRTRTSIASDLSDVTWSEDDGSLYVLSQEDETLLRLDADLEVVRAWPLDLEGLEGLAVRDGRLFAVSDAQARIYEIDLNRWRF
jgi:uncharacterized protein YjiK